MPSIKSCIASLAVVALAFAPIVSASPLKVDSLTRRTSSPAFYSNEAALEKRTESSARVKRAKLAAAKKAKRQSKARESEDLLKRAVSDIVARDGLTTRDLEHRDLVARALRRVRCGNSDAPCARAVTAPATDLPANGKAVCNPVSHLCAIGCQDGYILTSGQCVANTPTCGAQTCGTTPNGVFLCSGTNTCSLVCNTSEGYAATAAGTCISTRTDAQNCGAIGNVCPPSYNGIGTPSCKSGLCKLTCDAGYGVRRTQDLSALYCYGTGATTST